MIIPSNQNPSRRIAFATGVTVAAVLAMPAGAAVLTGEWQNTTFGSSGPITMEVTTTPTTYSLEITLGGFVFGSPTPPDPVLLTGNIEMDGSAVVSLLGHPTFGDASGNVDPAGVFSIAFTNVPAPGILSMDWDGTITSTSTSGVYRVDFDTGVADQDRVEGQDFALGTFNAVPETGTVMIATLGGIALLSRHRRRD